MDNGSFPQAQSAISRATDQGVKNCPRARLDARDVLDVNSSSGVKVMPRAR